MIASAFSLLALLALDTKHGVVEVPHGRIAYEEAGSGPPLILLHDDLLPGVTWDAQMEPLSRYFRVIRYDRRRYGKSTSENDGFSDVDDLEALFVALKIERAAIAGCSNGGSLAMDFTLAHKGRVEALVLESALVTGFGYSEAFGERTFRNRAPLFLKDDHAATIANWAKDRYLVDERNVEARAKLADLLKLNPFVAGGGSTGGREAPPALERLREIAAPTLVMVGESDAPDVQAHAGAISAAIAGSERQVVPNAGHLIHLERPDEFNRRLLDFLTPLNYVEEVRKRLAAGAPDLTAFTYDGNAVLDVGMGPEEKRGNVRIIEITYASARSGRVPAYLVLGDAKSADKSPGLLFLHHGQGDRRTFLDEAVALAAKGYVSLLIDAAENRKENAARTEILYDLANDRQFIEQNVTDLRRGLDVLASRPEADPTRLGFVGYSLGATMGARLLGVEPRIKASIQIAGFPALTLAFGEELRQAGTFYRAVSDETARATYLAGLAPLDGLRFLARRTPSPMLIQEAKSDQFITRLDGALFLAAAGKNAVLTSYPGTHFSLGDGPPREERLAFLLKTLPTSP